MNVCVKFIPRIPAHEIILFRSLVTFVISYAYLKRKGIYPLGENKLSLVLRGFFGMVSLTAFFITLQRMPLASAITLQYLSPFFTIIFSLFILGEKLRRIQWLFFIISLAGAIIVRGFDDRIATLDLILGIFSAVFSGLAYNMIRLAGRTEHPVVIVFYFPLVSLPFIGLWCLYEWVQPIGWEWFWLILTGVLTQFAQVSMTKAYQLEPPASISGLQYLGLIYSLVIGFFVFDEHYPVMSFVGMILIILGILLNLNVMDKMKQKVQDILKRYKTD